MTRKWRSFANSFINEWTSPLPRPTQANLVSWGFTAVLSAILLMALSCVSFLAGPSSWARDLNSTLVWWGIVGFVAYLFVSSFRNYRSVRRQIYFLGLGERPKIR
jgi:hypothetical protein